MADKKVSDELERALNRADISELIQQIEQYYAYSYPDLRKWPVELVEQLDGVLMSGCDDPEKGLAFVMLAAAKYDDREFLFLISAGTLENLLVDPSPEILGRIVEEARESPRIRWMLTGVYLHAIAEHARKPISAAINGWTETHHTPPRPCA
jgi:hypothetical protein